MSNHELDTGMKTRRIFASALGMLAIASLVFAVLSPSFLDMVFAEPSKNNTTPFKGNITGAIVSQQGDEKEKLNLGANASASSSAGASYKAAYPKEKADEKRPFMLQTDRHLYKAGEEVKIEGSILPSFITQIGGTVTSVKLNVTDNKGNTIVDQKEAQANEGEFMTAFSLPQNAQQGAYSIDASIDVKADVLASLQANKSKLETSTKFVVVSPNAFAVKAEGKDFSVDISSNSTVKLFDFKQQDKKISFHVEGQTGTQGITQITIPKALLGGQITVSIDGKVVPPQSSDVVTVADTEQETTLEINYHHSEHTIEVTGTTVVPEFPISFLVLAAALGSVLSVATIMTKKRSLVL